MNITQQLLALHPNAFNSIGRLNSNLCKDSNFVAAAQAIIDPYVKGLHGDYTLAEKLTIILNDIDQTSNCCKVCDSPTSLDRTKGANKFREFCSQACAHSASSGTADKIKATNLARYGVVSNLLLPAATEGMIRKYGGRGSGSPLIKEKIRQTNLSRYGVENVYAAPIIKEKIRAIHLAKFDNKMYSQQHIADDVLLKLNDLSFCQSICDDKKNSFSHYANELGVTPSTLLKYIRKHDLTVERKPTSSLEWLVTSMLDEHGISYSQNTRSAISSEIDIYLPQFNLGIEVHGVYWHCDSVNNNKFHSIQKRKEAASKGIHLMTFFEHEILDNFEIVTSMILNQCNMSTRLQARKSTIRELTYTEKKDFFIKTHIAGDTVSKLNYGLFINDELCCAISIGKSRFNKDAPYEIIRFANKLGHIVVGGFSKLFKYVTNKHQLASCSTFADLRFSKCTSVYHVSNFKVLDSTPPSYFYFKTIKGQITILSRYQTQKHKLQDLLDDFNPVESEYDNMINNGWKRVWDCGNSKLIWIK